MNRIFLYPSSYVLYAFRAYVFVVLFVISIFIAPSAYADPHAVFYTDRAQEQLFYNTLAALNQADFLEPVKDNQYSRETLLGRRADAVARNPQPTATPSSGDQTFLGEENPLITSTRTELPAILSRSITLEGDDLWTAYLVNQFAIESSSRRSTSELARIYCERGLGRAGCSNELDKDSQQQATAFTNLSVNRPSEVAFGRESILLSGDSDEDALRAKIRDNPQKERGDPLYVPRYQSPELAALRENIANNEGASGTLASLTSQTSGIASSGLDPETFTGVTYKDGEATLKKDISLDEYTYKLSQLTSLPLALRTIANAGAAKAQLSQYYEENPTAIADSKLIEKDDAIVREITVPPSAKIALLGAAAQLSVDAGQNQHFANPAQIAAPDGQARVIPTVAGATTTASSDGQVAGLATDLYDLYKAYYDTPPKKANAPSDNLINPERESGVYELLQAFTNDTYRKLDDGDRPETECGFCIRIDNILEQATDALESIFCVLFPGIERCKESPTP